MLGAPGIPLEAVEAMSQQIRMQEEAAHQQTRVIALQLAIASFGGAVGAGDDEELEERAVRFSTFIQAGKFPEEVPTIVEVEGVSVDT
jgi:hypothetical protein